MAWARWAWAPHSRGIRSFAMCRGWLLLLLIGNPLIFAHVAQYYGNDALTPRERCPPFCRCGDDSIECLDLRHKNPSIFRSIRPIHFPKLRYLTIGGADLLDLSDTNMFYSGSFDNLEYLNLTDCRITSIGANSFSAVRNVKFLYLTNNPLRTVHPFAFASFNRLETIDLSKSFDADRQNNLEVLKDIFTHPMRSLQNVYLHGNNLRDDITNLFCKFPNLLTLDLSWNRLSSIKTNELCASSDLMKLNLAFNSFTSIPSLPFQRLNQLDMHGNPLDCSDILPQLLRVENILERKNTTTCETPSNLKGHALAEMFPSKDSHGWEATLIVSGLVIGIMAIYFVRRRRLQSKPPPPRVYGLIQMDAAIFQAEDYV